MASGLATTVEQGAADVIRRMLATDGTATHPFPVRLTLPRDLSDTVHALCAVHGQHPDLLTIAAGNPAAEAEREWLREAATAFAGERAALARLTAAAGPLPSTPGQAQTSAALTQARHALEMLAQSERGGVALGAAAALVGDWQAIRAVLAHAADRFGVELKPTTLPALDILFGDAVAPGRALQFGAQQLLAQHRGVWSLLEARAGARTR